MTISVDEFCQSFPALSHHADRSHISALLDVLETQQVSAGKVLIEENNPSDTLYMLLDGSMTITMNTDGQTLSLGKIGKGSCIGEFTILDNTPAMATVTADTDCSVLTLSTENFWKLDKQNPAASTYLLRSLSHIMSDRIRAATDLILPLLDSTDAPADHDMLNSMLGNAYANLYGLGEKQ